MKRIQDLTSVLEFKNLIGTFVSQFLSGIRIDVTHHEIDLFLCIQADVGSLWDDSADQLMIVFAVGFLIRGTGVTVEHACSFVSLIILFDSHGIGKFAAVVCQKNREKLHKNVWS